MAETTLFVGNTEARCSLQLVQGKSYVHGVKDAWVVTRWDADVQCAAHTGCTAALDGSVMVCIGVVMQNTYSLHDPAWMHATVAKQAQCCADWMHAALKLRAALPSV